MFGIANLDQRRLGLMLGFGSLVWAGTYGALAKGLTPFLSPMTLLILSEGLTAMFIIFTFGLAPLLRELLRMDGRSLRFGVLIGLLNSVAAPLLWFSGLAHTSAINASILSSAEIIFTIIFAGFFLGETLKRTQVAGAAIVLLGVAIINFLPIGESTQIHTGDLLILLGSITYASGAVLFKKYLSHVMPELSIVIRNIIGVVTVFCISLLFRHSFIAEVKAFPVEKISLLIAFAFFSRYLNLTFFYEAIERLPATTLSLIEIGTPLSSILFAYLLLGESLVSHQILGGAFIISGLVIEQISVPVLLRRRSWFRLLQLRKRMSPVPVIHCLPRHI